MNVLQIMVLTLRWEKLFICQLVVRIWDFISAKLKQTARDFEYDSRAKCGAFVAENSVFFSDIIVIQSKNESNINCDFLSIFIFNYMQRYLYLFEKISKLSYNWDFINRVPKAFTTSTANHCFRRRFISIILFRTVRE